MVLVMAGPSRRRAEDLQRWIDETPRDPTLVKEVGRMAGVNGVKNHEIYEDI